MSSSYASRCVCVCVSASVYVVGNLATQNRTAQNTVEHTQHPSNVPRHSSAQPDRSWCCSPYRTTHTPHTHNCLCERGGEAGGDVRDDVSDGLPGAVPLPLHWGGSNLRHCYVGSIRFWSATGWGGAGRPGGCGTHVTHWKAIGKNGTNTKETNEPNADTDNLECGRARCFLAGNQVKRSWKTWVYRDEGNLFAAAWENKPCSSCLRVVWRPMPDARCVSVYKKIGFFHGELLHCDVVAFNATSTPFRVWCSNLPLMQRYRHRRHACRSIGRVVVL